MNDQHKYWLIKWFADIQTATHVDTVAHYNATIFGYLQGLNVCNVVSFEELDIEHKLLIAATEQRVCELKAKQ